MRVSKRCQYALRAVFELALRDRTHPVKIRQIAAAQNIPPRFLELILNELRHAGFVESRRGKRGGYMLAKAPEGLKVGEVITYIQGPISLTVTSEREPESSEPFYGDYVFRRFWANVNGAISEACNNSTFAELVELERAEKTTNMPDYSI